MRDPVQAYQEELSREEFINDFVGEYSAGLTEEERLAEEQRLWEEKLQVFGNGIEAEAQEFERLRKPVEDRMLEDMRQYLGVEDRVDRLNKKAGSGSDLNVNITRKKTNAAEARLSDMLFPTDDKNWGLVPSPVPTVAIEGMPESAPAELQPAPQPMQQPDPQQIPPQSDAEQVGVGQQAIPQPEAMVAGIEQQAPQPLEPALTPEEETLRNAKARAALMEKVLDDQLTECDYASVGREAIRAGCMLGTGVIKGPVRMGRGRRMWSRKEDGLGNVAYVLVDVQDDSPGFELVPTWDFFPTMSATRIEDSEVTFQRHWMTRRDLIRLAKRDDFMPDQIRRVLRNSPDRTPPDYLTQLRDMSEITGVGDEKRYVVWERHGPVDIQDLQACGVIDKDAEVDPLEEYQGVVWVCQGIVIKAAVNPMDTEDQPFSVFNFERDDSCIFGYGVPYLMRQPQKVVTAAWRMIMDNSNLSVGGQIIINKKIIEPAPTPDGKQSWEITPLKIWLLSNSSYRAADAFHVFEFPNHQNELAAIFNLARAMADEETGIPQIAEGDQGQHVTQTAHGMEMLMNSHNIVMRRAVKNWDDNVTVPNILRLYDWNMQNNPNDDIKGDFSPEATGSAALLLKETQARNMLNLVNFLMNPALIGWAHMGPLVRKLVSSMQHDPDELIKTQKEYDAFMQQQQAAAAQQQPQGPNHVEVQRMKNDLAWAIHQAKMQDNAADRQMKALLADTQREIEMMRLAQHKEITLGKVAAEVQKIREKSIADRTLMADEFKIKLETGSGI